MLRSRTRSLGGWRAAVFARHLIVLLVLVAAAHPVLGQDVMWERVPPPEGWWDTYKARGLDVGPDSALLVAARGLGPGEPRAVLRLPRGGNSWQVFPVTGSLNDVAVSPEGFLVIDIANRLRRSTNGGHTWTEVYDKGAPLSRLTEGPHAGTLFSGKEGFTGMTVRSDDSGATWHEPQLPPVNLNCRAFMAHPLPEHPERVLAGCAYGVAVSDDGGLTFEASELWVSSPVHVGRSFARLPDGTAIAMVGGGCCAGGIYRSTDGVAWELVFDTGGQSRLAVAGGALYAVRWDGAVWRSNDGGESWEQLPLVYEGEGNVRVDAIVTGPDGRLWAAVGGSGPAAERHGVYRTVEPVVSVAEGPEAEALAFEVWPNPLSGTATASFALDEPGRFRLAVYDMLGRLVTVAFEGDADAGAIEVPLNLTRLSSGVYLLRLEAAGEQSVRHVVRRLTIAR